MQAFNGIQTLILWMIPLIFAITVHETAHAWAANRLGDSTAKMLGRVSLNPVKHIDLVGTLILPAIFILLKTGFIFGWAKPVPINWSNLRNQKRDRALVAAAGPTANLLMALAWAAIAKLGLCLLIGQNIRTGLPLYYVGSMGITINCVFFILNLLPLPPLDGSRILSSFLTPRMANYYARLEPYGFIILLALLFMGGLKLFLFPLIVALSGIIMTSFGLPLPLG